MLGVSFGNIARISKDIRHNGNTSYPGPTRSCIYSIWHQPALDQITHIGSVLVTTTSDSSNKFNFSNHYFRLIHRYDLSA